MSTTRDGSADAGTTAHDGTLGLVQRIDDRTVLVLGQELNVDAKQPDVANALVHRAGDTIVIVDTGVTSAFRTALKAAVEDFGDAERLLLLTPTVTPTTSATTTWSTRSRPNAASPPSISCRRETSARCSTRSTTGPARSVRLST